MHLIPISITLFIFMAQGAMATSIRGLPGPQILYPHQQSLQSNPTKQVKPTNNTDSRPQQLPATGPTTPTKQETSTKATVEDLMGPSNADEVLDSMPSDTLFIVTMMKNMLKGKGGGNHAARGYNQPYKMMMRPNYYPNQGSGTSYKYGGYGKGSYTTSAEYGPNNSNNYNENGGSNYENSNYKNNNYGGGQSSYENSGEVSHNNYNYNNHNNNNYGQTTSYNNNNNYEQNNNYNYNNNNGGGGDYGVSNSYSSEQGISGEGNHDNGPNQNQGGYGGNDGQGHQQNNQPPPIENNVNNDQQPERPSHTEVHHHPQDIQPPQQQPEKLPERPPEPEVTHNDIGQDNHVGNGEGPRAVKNYDTLWREFVINFFTNKYHSNNN